ncbi:hypothetical protein H0A61_02065 [Koleobacter methoxysyntrophicus]|jgi:hypothetical protein|uniref:Uncharacterized protein n=1 Tax=Koleobacter methoxysyntrophicus TaxID=2751313 RepID=A0A8A0RR59_9FIRM|nr:hypothetical protein [Koleobacter methoxysyntrophicus]QSQ09686.1 hypothetical protein H0A61_02065 [Koleobacter methoxysyntrophicus]
MEKSRIYRFLKGIFRVQTGFALVRIWSLNKVYPRKINIHLLDLFNKMRQREMK